MTTSPPVDALEKAIYDIVAADATLLALASRLPSGLNATTPPAM